MEPAMKAQGEPMGKYGRSGTLSPSSPRLSSAEPPPARQVRVSTENIFHMAVAKKHHFFHY
jgi:hypothetical protein